MSRQSWYERSWHFLVDHILWVALLLLVGMIFLIKWYDERDLFSRRVTPIILNNLVTLQLSYSDPLPVFTAEEARTKSPLYLWVSDTESIPATSEEWALHVSVQEPALALLDLDGQPLRGKPLAIAQTLSQLSAGFHLAAVDTATELPVYADLLVTISPTYSTTMRTITVDNLPGSDLSWQKPEIVTIPLDTSTAYLPLYPLQMGLILRIIVQRADTLALFLAIAAGVWEWERWRREKKQAGQERHITERQDFIDETASSLQQQWVDGLVALASAFTRSQGEKWDETLTRQIVSLKALHCRSDRQGEFLRKIGSHHRQDDDIAALYSRLASADLLQMELPDSLRIYLKILNKRVPEAYHLPEVFKLWESHSYDASDVIVGVSSHMLQVDRRSAETRIIDELRKPGREGLNLLPGLREFADIPPDPYTWPAAKIPQGDGRQRSDAQFLADRHFKDDPFASIGDMACPNTLSRLAWLKQPAAYVKLMSASFTLHSTEFFDDNIACVEALLLDYLQPQSDFPVAGIGHSLRIDLPATEAWLTLLCEVAAAWWIDLLATNLNAFLALSDANKEMLFDLLQWHCGSIAVMLRQLDLDVAKHPQKGPTKGRNMEDQLKPRLYELHSQRPRVVNPPPEQLLEWLSIRPPGRDRNQDSTVMLVALPPSTLTFGVSHDEYLQRQLSDRMIRCHIIGGRGSTHQRTGPSYVHVRWSDLEIRAMIDNRIKSAGAQDIFTFADLVSPPPDGPADPYSHLLAAARGSLYRTLKYCRVAVRLHQQSDEHPDVLMEQSLQKALDEIDHVDA